MFIFTRGHLIASRGAFSLRGLLGVMAALLVLCLLAGWFVFGRDLPKLARIAGARAVDKVEATVRGPILERDYEDVVQANTEQALEIESYLAQLDRPERRTPEGLGVDFTSEGDYLRSTDGLRASLAASLGYPPPDLTAVSAPPAMVRIAEDELATYYDFRAPVFGDVSARGVFMMPRTATGKVPLVIAVHGRGGLPPRPRNGKLTVVSRSNRDLARGALEKGYAVWEPILVFYARDRTEDIRERLDFRAQEYGTSLPAIEISKIRRGLDALLGSQPIDETRIAMVGMSYGGFYTLFTTALEERIRVAVVAAYFNDRAAILRASEPFGNSDWRFSTSLSLFQDPTLAALVCPRPLQIQAGDHDQLFPIEGARKVIPAARMFYERLGIAERFSFVEFVGRHDFNGDAAWEFVEKVFQSPPVPKPREQNPP